MAVIIDLPSVLDTDHIASRMATVLAAPLVITFSGEIGAGKTSFIRAMLRALGIESAIKSPTFSLVETYGVGGLQIHHFDLYRVHDESELDLIGFRDYFADDAVCCIEWPERVTSNVNIADVGLTLNLKGSGREMQLSTFTPLGASMLSRFLGES